MTLKERYAGVIAWFEEHMPVAESELAYGSPYELLVAVILSAQCTDKRVNMTTPALFEAFPTPQAMAAATGEKDRTALAARFVRYGEASRPDAERHAYYQKQYQLYKDLREFEVRHVKG